MDTLSCDEARLNGVISFYDIVFSDEMDLFSLYLIESFSSPFFIIPVFSRKKMIKLFFPYKLDLGKG